MAYAKDMIGCGLLDGECGSWNPSRNNSAQLNLASFWQTIGARGKPKLSVSLLSLHLIQFFWTSPFRNYVHVVYGFTSPNWRY